MANSAAVKAIIATLVTVSSAFGILKATISSSSEHLDTSESLSGGENLHFASKADLSTQRNQYSYSEKDLEEGSALRETPVREWQQGRILEDSEEKRRIREEANNVYKVLNDYTFKIVNPNCSAGTAWILDYQLPEEEGKYPTTWYIATNAHVVQLYRFSENRYNQLLPWENLAETKVNREKYKNWFEYFKRGAASRDSCSTVYGTGYLDIGLVSGEAGKKREGEYGLYSQGLIEEPRLFFSAFNFLKPREGLQEDYYADFVVLELEFKDEKEAKRITRDFANKYKVDSTEAINIFASPLEKRYSKTKLSQLKENYYLLAYPAKKGNQWEYTKNFDEEKAIASQLAGSAKENPEDQEYYKGFVDAQEAKGYRYRNISWNNKSYREFGHWYEMNHNPLEAGSSGGLFVDGRLNAISVNVAGSLTSFSVPLRSKGIKFKEWGWWKDVETPEFDLILGGKNHLHSYKDQVLKFNKRTWLRERGWKDKPKNLSLST